MPLKITTKGSIELWRGTTVKVSTHTIETEAIERATADYESTGAPLYTLKYPNKEIDLSRLTRVIRDVDATRPSTPTGLAGTPQGETSIQLTWNAATDPQGAASEAVSGVVGYKLYRNGSIYITQAGTSYNDVGGSPYTVYTYRVSSYDAAGNESFQSAPISPRTLDLTAPTAPTITATQTGQTSISVALTTAATDSLSGVASYVLEYKRTVDSTWISAGSSIAAASFPVSISGLSASTQYDTRCRATDVSGNVGPNSATSQATTAAAGGSTAFDTDWNLLKSGAVMSTRFATQAEVDTYKLADSKVGNISWDSTVSWFGHALKFNIPTGDSANSGNWARHMDDAFGAGACAGIPSDTGYNPPMTFEIAYAVYITAEMRNTIFPGGEGWKTSHFSHDKASNSAIEIVWQNSIQRGYVQGYHRNPPNVTTWDVSFFPSPACAFASPDFKHQPAIDHGSSALVNLAAVNPITGAAWSNCEKVWAQYGGNYSYGGSGYQDAAGSSRLWKFWELLDPAGLNIGPMLYPANDWIVLKVRVDLNSYSAATNRIRWYAARRLATSWTLLADESNLLLPQDNDGSLAYNQRFNTVWLDPFHSSRTSGGGVSTAMWYGWLVSRRDGGSIPVPQVWPELETSTVEQKFAAMAAGTFDTLNTPSMTSSVINNGSADSIMSWARRGHWDPASASAPRAYFYGCTHSNSNPAQNYNYMIRYEADTQTWLKETINDPEPFAAGGIHGYYHHALRTSDGRQFLRARGSATVYSRARGGAWETTTVPAIPGTFFLEWNVGDALEWYPDFGTAGALVFTSQTACYTWQPGDSAWVKRGTFAGTAGNDDWICYNRANNRMYFGGGTGFYRKMRRLDPNGTVTVCADTPFNCGVTPDDGSNTIFVGPVISSGLPQNKMFAVDPNPGRAIMEYNHLTDAWTSTGASLPFNPSQQMYFHVTVPNVGVFFHFLSGNPNPSSVMHLWRR